MYALGRYSPHHHYHHHLAGLVCWVITNQCYHFTFSWLLQYAVHRPSPILYLVSLWEKMNLHRRRSQAIILCWLINNSDPINLPSYTLKKYNIILTQNNTTPYSEQSCCLVIIFSSSSLLLDRWICSVFILASSYPPAPDLSIIIIILTPSLQFTVLGSLQ